MQVVPFMSTIFRIEQQSMADIMLTYRTGWTTIWWKNLAKNKVLFHRDNARMHTLGKFKEWGYEFLPYPPQYWDLASNDHFSLNTRRKVLAERDVASSIKSSLKRKRILSTSLNRFIWIGKKYWATWDKLYTSLRRLHWRVRRFFLEKSVFHARRHEFLGPSS